MNVNSMSNGNGFNIVMLTNGNAHGIRILEGLKSVGITLQAVVLETRDSVSDHIYPGTQLYALRFVKALRRYLLSIESTRRIIGQLSQYSNVVPGGCLNSDAMCAKLEILNPDFIVLGGIGIVSERIIGIPSSGVLNAHPGLLPWLRGTGVVSRAVERGIPVGGTCHYVDKKVDTGNIIERRLLQLNEKYYSLSELELNADALASNMMVQLIESIVRRKEIPKCYPQKEMFPVCKWMSQEDKVKLNVLLEDRVPSRVFKEWARHCRDQTDYILNSDFRGTEI
jgi:hypothetical protein